MDDYQHRADSINKKGDVFMRDFTMREHNGTGWDELHPKTSMGQVEGLNSKMSEVEAVAKGASKGLTFDTKAEMDAWLEVPANVETLNVGDNLYIRELDVPDYWWDGETVQPLATEKVVLNNATTEDDGLLSKDDKSKLDDIAAGATRVTAPSDIGAADASHTHTSAELSIPVTTISSNAPLNPKVGDIWYDTGA